MNSKSNQIDMTKGPIFLKLIKFSMPIIISGVLQLFFNAADVIVVGRFAGDNSLAAVGSTGSLVNLLVNLFVGLSVGTNVVAAAFFGAGDENKISKTVHTALLLSFISGIVLTVVGVIGAKQILVLMKSPDGVIELSTLYLQIYFGGITATMIYNFGSALLRAKGDTFRPMIYLLSAGVINVILNCIFVIFLKMDVAGVALATVISQCISAILVVRCLMKESDAFHFSFSKLGMDREILIKIIRIGVPAGFQGMLFSFSNVLIQSSINSFGAVTVAGNSAAQNVEGFVYVSMNGIAQGTLTFVSQNRGAGKNDRILKVIWASLLAVSINGLVLGNLAWIFGKKLLWFYSKNADVITAGAERLLVICSTYMLCGIMDVMANGLRGIGHSLSPMIITLIGACLSRIVWIATIFQIERFHSPFVIFLSYPISWIMTFVALFISFMIIYNKEILKKNELKY